MKLTPSSAPEVRAHRGIRVPGLAPDDWVVVAGGHLLREGEAVAPVDRDNRPVALAGATSERAQ